MLNGCCAIKARKIRSALVARWSCGSVDLWRSCPCAPAQACGATVPRTVLVILITLMASASWHIYACVMAHLWLLSHLLVSSCTETSQFHGEAYNCWLAQRCGRVHHSYCFVVISHDRLPESRCCYYPQSYTLANEPSAYNSTMQCLRRPSLRHNTIARNAESLQFPAHDSRYA